MDKYDGFIVTERTGYAVETGVRTYGLSQVNRREFRFPFVMLVNAIKSAGILVRERPDALVCTGALATVPILLLARLAGIKIIFIESFAKVDSPTETGRLAYRIADRFYVQWKSMLECYPAAVCVGGVY